MSKCKEIILKAVREKYQVTYKGRNVRITSGILSATLKPKKAWMTYLQPESNNCQPRSPNHIKPHFKFYREIIDQYKHKVREFITTKHCRI